MLNEAELITRFSQVIPQLPEHAFDDHYPPHSSLRLYSDGPFEVYYAPLDYVNSSARITIVGLTPGKHTMCRSLAVVKSMMQGGFSWEEAQKAAKLKAAFSNARDSLAEMLDYIGLCEWLRRVAGNPSIASCREIFGTANSFVHMTSVIRYPTFFKGKNYSGTPDPLKNSFLRQMIDTIFRREVQRLPDTGFVPLGDTVSSVFEYLQVEDKRVLYGLPHPSGANMERINYCLDKKRRELLSPKTNPVKIDAAKRRLLGKVPELLNAVNVR